MSRHVLKAVKFSALFLLISVSLVSIITVIFTYNKPQSVIDLLQPLVPTDTPAPITMKGVAVLGDSQADEYRADDNRGYNYPATTLNWIEILEKKRNVNFGPWSVWEEPRRTGYEYNWARTGNTTASMIQSEHHIGVAEQIKQGKVNVVVIFIGANDFAPYILDDGYHAIYNGELSEPAKKSKVNRIIADIKTAVYTIKDAGDVRVVLVKVPDWGQHVGVQVAFPFPDQRNDVSKVIRDVNAEMDKLANDEGLVTVDPNALYQSLVYKNEDNKMMVDGITIERLLLNNNPKNFYLEDGVHTGTAVNGFMANAIVKQINTMIDNDIQPLSEKEIRETAGL
ncbi:MAG: SGNH/GDSL hydrolase family protein [Candidatus Levybacteria bacterium]|nr:SGNH/GDSL hydrolase family protein [Candidatus Levybacteria bacterium]